MISKVTGTEFNNPDVCIKGDPNFACLCQNCKPSQEVIIDRMYKGGWFTEKQVEQRSKKVRFTNTSGGRKNN